MTRADTWPGLDPRDARLVTRLHGAKNDDILGAHIVGAHGGELLAEIALAMKTR